MKKFMFTVLALYVFAFIGCATPAKKVVAEKPKPARATTPVPEQKPDEVAVFGRVILTETVNQIPMPTEKQDATLYLNFEGRNTTMKISCSDAGEFGVYLPAGSYRLTKASAGDHTFTTDMTLVVPEDQKAVYAGTLVLDGYPNGMDAATGGSTFAYSVRDDQEYYEALIRKSLPGAKVAFYKSLLSPRGGIMTGASPSRVHRAKDLDNDLRARTGAVEEVAKGVIISLSYIISPVWIFTIGQ